MTDRMPETQPALTAEEWNQRPMLGNVWVVGDEFLIPIPNNHEEYSAHGIAALCLFQQPFGFSQEDVGILKAEIALLELIGDHPANQRTLTGKTEPLPAIAGLRSLASRISALLPPSSSSDQTP